MVFHCAQSKLGESLVGDSNRQLGWRLRRRRASQQNLLLVSTSAYQVGLKMASDASVGSPFIDAL